MNNTKYYSELKAFDAIILRIITELTKITQAFSYQKLNFLYKLIKYSIEKIYENGRYLFLIYTNNLDKCVYFGWYRRLLHVTA